MSFPVPQSASDGSGAYRTNPGTVFPSMDGAPGDGGAISDNREDMPTGDPLIDATLEGLGDLPLAEVSVANADEDYRGDSPDSNVGIDPNPSHADPSGGISASGKKNTISARISALTSRYRQAVSDRDILQAKLSQLEQTVSALMTPQTPGSLPAQAPAQAVPNLAGLLSGVPESSPSPAAGGDANAALLSQIGAMIDQKIQPVVRQTAESALRSAQEDSYSQVVAERPAFGQKGSQEYEAFWELFHKLPYANQAPDGPATVALIVDGMLSRERPTQAATVERKVSAQIQTPQAPPANAAASLELRQLKTRYDEAARKLKLGDNSFQVYRELRESGQMLRQAMQRSRQ